MSLNFRFLRTKYLPAAVEQENSGHMNTTKDSSQTWLRLEKAWSFQESLTFLGYERMGIRLLFPVGRNSGIFPMRAQVKEVFFMTILLGRIPLRSFRVLRCLSESMKESLWKTRRELERFF